MKLRSKLLQSVDPIWIARFTIKNRRLPTNSELKKAQKLYPSKKEG